MLLPGGERSAKNSYVHHMNVWVSKHNHAIYFTDDTFATCLQKNGVDC